MSKPEADPSSGISSGDVLRLPERHPACRRREARPGSCAERENLAGDAKGKGTSGSNREAESTDAEHRGGVARSRDEGSVMGLDRRGCARTDVLSGAIRSRKQSSSAIKIRWALLGRPNGGPMGRPLQSGSKVGFLAIEVDRVGLPRPLISWPSTHVPHPCSENLFGELLIDIRTYQLLQRESALLIFDVTALRSSFW
jgi:hypothetical protein